MEGINSKNHSFWLSLLCRKKSAGIKISKSNDPNITIQEICSKILVYSYFGMQQVERTIK